MSSRQSREELARFLRTRRQRIAPAQVGLPDGRRRRTNGLRREEVAVLAGLSPTWYTYLEQARDIRPSPEVLDSLANVLALTDDERQYMHQLTFGREPALPPRDSAGIDLSLVTDLVHTAGTGPFPVYALDYSANVIAWNAAAAEWYTNWGERHGWDRNMVWWLLTSDEARQRIVDWAQDARDITARTRAQAARSPQERQLQALIARLRETSAEFRQWWANHEVRGQRTRIRRLRHPVLGERPMRLAVVHPGEDPRVTIAFHLPITSAANQHGGVD